MYPIIRERLKQKRRTIAFPAGSPPPLPARFRGLPVLDESKCPNGCQACADVCPTEAIDLEKGLSLDLGRCLFCTECIDACPTGAIQFSGDHRISSRTREDLVVRSGTVFPQVAPLEKKRLSLFGRSLKLRQVSAAGDNSCEADLNVLGTVVFDLSRFGIQFLASPRHCDGIVVTGPISENMRFATLDTYRAVPAPKIVIVVGVDPISGGVFRGNPEVHNGLQGILPIDLYVPGNPPHPLTILDGILRLIGRIERGESRETPVVATSARSLTSHPFSESSSHAK
jgi:Ni,Fe-hydrogenase III small subunit/NAD-dependent dihydropyrimidine dehydrogenase PreA subunit